MRATVFAAMAVACFTTALRANDTGTAVVVHAIPGVTVDVFVGGTRAIAGFEPGTTSTPLQVPEGTYELAVTLPGDEPEDAILTASAFVAAGSNLSIVAHLNEAAEPTLSIFANDLSSPERRLKGRLVVRHVAAAPTVDVALGWFGRHIGTFEGVSNGDEKQVDLWLGVYRATIFPAGADEAVFGPAKVLIRPRQSTIVYAYGSLADGTFGLLVQRLAIPRPVPTTGRVSVVHGVPGLTVDVYVNDNLTLENFEPGTITDPLELPAADYRIAITPAGGDPASPAIEGSASLAGGASVSIVAHLDAGGSPTLSVFANDLRRARFLRGRVVVRHTAAAPAVDVKVQRRRWFSATLRDVANGGEASADLFAGHYSATIFPTGSREAVFGPARLQVRAAKSTIVYAIGSLDDGSFTLLVQRLSLSRYR